MKMNETCENCLFFRQTGFRPSGKFRVFNSYDEMKKAWKGTKYFREDHFGYVYICQFGTNVKIGQTKEPLTRISTHEQNLRIYGNNVIGKIALTRDFPFYKELEDFLHKKFSEYSVQREVFNISFERAVDALTELLCEPFFGYLYSL